MPTSKFDPPLVIAVHGIRTDAKWQKTLAGCLSKEKIPCELYDFGRYFLRFFRKASNESMVNQFYDYYRSVLKEFHSTVDVTDYTRRPSIVAHSFGTYIVGYAMEKFEGIRFDKVLLCGSVLPRDFDWSLLVARDQVNLIRNEFGVKDFWTRVVRYAVSRTGDSGNRGFDLDCSFLQQKRFEQYRHSDFFHRQHFDDSWLPFLRHPPSHFTILHSRNIETPEHLNHIRKSVRAIDESTFGKLPHHKEAEIPLDLPPRWLEINPDIYTYLMDRRDNTCKGYINGMPICERKFKQLRAGECLDRSVQPSDVVPFTPDKNVRLYIMSISTDPTLRRVNTGLYPESFQTLVNGFCDKLVYYAVEKGIRVSEIAAVAWTELGLRLCEMLGMVEVAKDRFGHPVYAVELAGNQVQNRRILPGLARLLKVYK